MSERNRLLRAIATTISDYQAGTFPTPTPEHIENWINNFSKDVQEPILNEVAHVFEKTYFSKIRVRGIMKGLVRHPGWTAGDPPTFWRQVNFLNIQPRGNSQRELLTVFDKKLNSECGFSIEDCGHGNKYFYLNDGLFSGGRIGMDLENWIVGSAPQRADLLIAVIALHTQGHYFTNQSLNKAIARSGKQITLNWAHYISIEDGLHKASHSDVLRPTTPGIDPDVNAYVAQLGKPQTWRTGKSIGPNKFFSSSQGRELLEHEFLKKGVEIRGMCPLLNIYQRPLGNTTMRTFGFGTLFATYRNCPNNAPLVLWAGDPWYPLLPRITN